MNKIGKEKGITLVALIVTIIVLLILAGISIGAITGNNGIIDNANFASFSTKIRQYQEKVDMYVIKEEQENKHGSANVNITDPGKIKEILEDIDDEESKKYVIQDNELKYMPDNVTNQEEEWLIELKVSAYEIPPEPTEPTLVKKWATKIDGNGEEEFLSVKQTSDGGYIAVGYTTSTDIPGLTNKGSADCLIAKFDSNGNEKWKKTVGGSKYDWYNDVIEITNGTYIAVGTILSTEVVDKSGKNIGHGYDWSIDSGPLTASMAASEGIIGTYDSNGNEVSLKTTGKAIDTFKESDLPTSNNQPFDIESTSSTNVVIIGINKVSDGYIITGKRFIGVPSSMADSNIIEGHLAIKYAANGNEIAVTNIDYNTSMGGYGTEINIDNYKNIMVVSRAWRGVIELSNNNYILYGCSRSPVGGTGLWKSDASLSNIQEFGDANSIIKGCILDKSENYITINNSMIYNDFIRLEKQSNSGMIWEKTDKVIKSISKSGENDFVGLSDDKKLLKYNMDDGSILEEYDIPTYEEIYAIEGQDEFILLGTPKDEDGISITGTSGAVIAKYAIE